jgi:hypothetical protein
MPNRFHYTNTAGWNAIRAQPAWHFKTFQPNDPERPRGAYFTDIEPTETNLRTLYKRLRVPKLKQEYIFWFTGTEGLTQFRDGRGRDRRIFFSPVEYVVENGPRQKHGNTTESLIGTFT